jgi:CRISPR-associated protein, Csm2 family
MLSSAYLECLKSGYFDGNDNLKCELLTSLAEQVARDLGKSGITSTQLRRFFTQVRSIERKLGQQQDFLALVPQIQCLKPMAANYVGKGNNQWELERRKIFKQFIDLNVELATRDEKGFSFKKGFVPHFESVIAYYKYHFPNK